MIDSWISKAPELLPDFIIGGAMKSGTTTLHTILDRHPDVSIAKGELGFFDMDDLLVHQDFNYYDGDTRSWVSQDLTQDPSSFWEWYHTKFKDLPNKLKGEDSTTYLTSMRAAQRLAKQVKPIKLIFILRHPTQRAISNYLHALKSGRAFYSLEDTLVYHPQSILNRSLYTEQLGYYYTVFPKEQIKVVLFEDLVSNPESCIEDLCVFLGLDAGKFKPEDFVVHSNKTKIPKYINLQLFRNRLLKGDGAHRYSKFVPSAPKALKDVSIFHKLADKLHRRVNPMSTAHSFEVAASTQELLDTFFREELQNINALTNLPIYERWFGD